ncbi:MAG: hypothetical protein LBS85_04525, partial [Clostridiales Family XIII bacterium]|nr:hypothetical protein [Clostridiales Family XIII bacterium]
MMRKRFRSAALCWGTAALLALLLVPVPASFAAAAPAPADDGSLRVTGYSVESGGVVGYTGKITKDNTVTIVLNVSDDRSFLAKYTGGNQPKPQARLNTDSFLIPGQGNIKIANLAAPAAAGKGWSYTLRFENMIYTGIGKTFRCDIFYGAGDAADVVTYALDVHQCEEYTAPAAPEPADPGQDGAAVDVKGTGFVLKSASYGQADIYAGQPFTLSTALLATNGV